MQHIVRPVEVWKRNGNDRDAQRTEQGLQFGNSLSVGAKSSADEQRFCIKPDHVSGFGRAFLHKSKYWNVPAFQRIRDGRPFTTSCGLAHLKHNGALIGNKDGIMRIKRV